MISRRQLLIRKDGQLVTSNQIYAVICRYPKPTTGENICIDGGMTKQMIYHGGYGCKLEK